MRLAPSIVSPPLTIRNADARRNLDRIPFARPGGRAGAPVPGDQEEDRPFSRAGCGRPADPARPRLRAADRGARTHALPGVGAPAAVYACDDELRVATFAGGRLSRDPQGLRGSSGRVREHDSPR